MCSHDFCSFIVIVIVANCSLKTHRCIHFPLITYTGQCFHRTETECLPSLRIIKHCVRITAAAHFFQLKIVESGASIMSVSAHKAVIQAVEFERKPDSTFLLISFLCFQSKHPPFKGSAVGYVIILINSWKHTQ